VYNTPGAVSLGACWKGNYDGDLDFPGTPVTPLEDRRAVNLWYPIDESTFEQYVWFNEEPESWYRIVDKWQGKNIHAGVGCYSWGQGTTSYTMMISKDHNIEIYWKDTTPNGTATHEHPINVWRNATDALLPDVYPSTSLAYTTYLYAQMADRTIKAFNIAYAAENTTYVPEDTFVLSGKAGAINGVGGTHLYASAYAYYEEGEVMWDSFFFSTKQRETISQFSQGQSGLESGRLEVYSSLTSEWRRRKATVHIILSQRASLTELHAVVCHWK
jgi:hypothetical protein